MHWKHTLTVFVAGMASAAMILQMADLTASAQENKAPSHTADNVVSYALGWDLGQEAMANLSNDGVAVDATEMTRGFSAAISGDNPAHETHRMTLALIEFNDEIFDRLHRDRMLNDPVYRAQAAANARAGEAFRSRFAALPNVKSTGSGALYRVEKEGDGASPKIGDFVIANYRILLLDGTEIGEENGAVIDTSTMLNFGQELVLLMQIGDKWTVLVAPKGDGGRASRGEGIGPNEAIIAEIELLDITDQPDE